jgi:hypothetical protein
METHQYKNNHMLKRRLSNKMEVVIRAVTMFFAIVMEVSAKLPRICNINGVKHNSVFGFTLIFLKNRHGIFVYALAGGRL